MKRDLLLDIDKVTVQSGAGRLRDFSLKGGRGLLFLMHSEDLWKITSLFQVLAGLELPLEGYVRYDGQGIGLVLAEDELPAWSSVRDELDFYARLTGLPREGLESLMETWNLEGIYGLPVAALSTHERKSFFLVLEIAARPDLLLCQEPLLGLSPRQQRKVLANLRQYADQGRIVILGSVDPGQYPPSIPRVSLDRTGQQYQGSDLVAPGESTAAPQEADESRSSDFGQPESLKAPPDRQRPTGETVPPSPLDTVTFHPEVPDSERVSRAYRGSGLPHSEEPPASLPRITRQGPDPARLLSSADSFGGRRLLTLFVSLPVGEETEYQLRRIAEIKYFQAVDNGYEVDVLEEDQAKLTELLGARGFPAGPRPGRDDR